VCYITLDWKGFLGTNTHDYWALLTNTPAYWALLTNTLAYWAFSEVTKKMKCCQYDPCFASVEEKKSLSSLSANGFKEGVIKKQWGSENYSEYLVFLTVAYTVCVCLWQD
jgi:hypothetical protein